MYKLVLFLVFVLILSSCKKKKNDFPTLPTSIYQLDKISTLTPSGATVSYQFNYTGSNLTSVNDFNLSTGLQIFHHEFTYEGNKLVKLDTYRPSGSTSALERRLLLYYAGSQISKIERYFFTNNIPFLSSFITYTYNTTGQMIKKISTNQQSWGEQIVARSDYTYDAPGNINKIIMEYPLGGPLTMQFTPAYSTIPNTLSSNNPSLFAFIWYLIDANFFMNGFEEVFLFSKNFVSGVKRDINGLVHDYNFTFEFDGNKNLTRIINYPNPYSYNTVDPVFHDMRLSYILK